MNQSCKIVFSANAPPKLFMMQQSNSLHADLNMHLHNSFCVTLKEIVSTQTCAFTSNELQSSVFCRR